MNVGRLLTQAWRLVWRHKFLWPLGLVVALGNVIGMVLRVGYWPQLRNWFDNPLPTVIDPLAAAEPTPLFAWLLGGSLLFLIVSLGYWLVATLAQGAIIRATIDLAAHRPASLRSTLRWGWRWLGRFVAIDTLVYLPLFLLTLLLMLLALALLVALAWLLLRPSSTDSLAAALALGLVCLLPLAILLLPVGLLTAAFRTLAFRDAAVCERGARDSIRQTWALIRRRWGGLLVLWLLLWGLGYLPGLLLGVGTLPLTLLTAARPSFSGWLGWGAGAVAAVPWAILHAFIAVTWTLAYMELSREHET